MGVTKGPTHISTLPLSLSAGMRFSVTPPGTTHRGFPDSSVGKESACSAGETPVRFLGQEDPLEKG